jgi:hypothetical protein
LVKIRDPLSAVISQRRSFWTRGHKISSVIPCQPCPTTVCRVVTMGDQQVGYLPGQVFIDLEPRAHWPPMR